MTNISQTEGAGNGQSTCVNAFDRYSEAGFLTELLPIMPPDAALSEHSKIDPDSRGKTPGRMYSNAWGGFPGWQGHFVTTGDVKRWSRWPGVGVGLQARKHPGVDIDVLDEAASEALGELAEKHLGAAPERIGNPPKRLLAYRLEDGADPFKKRRVEFTLPDDPTKHAVEVLGDGQQYVIEGVHAKTGNPYTWTNGSPADWTHDGLTGITASGADTYMDAVRAEVERLGGTVLGASQGGAGDGAARPQEGLAGDPETVREALEALGNDQPYDEWIKLVAACKAALGEEGYDVYEAWCLRYAQNTAEVARDKWDSCHPPFRVGAPLIYEKAAEAGWKGYGAAMGMEPVDVDDTQAPPPPPDVKPLYQWCYAESVKRFVHLSTRDQLDESAFNRRMAEHGYAVQGEKAAASVYFKGGGRQMVDTVTYLPGHRVLTTTPAGKSAVNLWTPPAMGAWGTAPKDADVRTWLDHMEFIIPDKVAREHVLDWMAYTTQHPSAKVNHAIFLGGAQGIGKNMALAPLIDAVGQQNKRAVTSEMLQEIYTGWAEQKRLIVVEEMRSFETKAVMNKLKTYITDPPAEVPIRPMYQPAYEAPNVLAFVFMSNHRDALSLEQGDRRYFVYWSPAAKGSEAYYGALDSWLKGGGTEKVVGWLHDRDVSAFKPAAPPPYTADKRDMELAGQPEGVRMVCDMIAEYDPPFAGEAVALSDAWASAKAKAQGTKVSRAHVEKALELMGGGPVPWSGRGARVVKINGVSKRVWAVRDLQACEAMPGATLVREHGKSLEHVPDTGVDTFSVVQNDPQTP